MKKLILFTQLFCLSIVFAHGKIWNVNMTSSDTFSPSTLTIVTGDTVVWHNTDTDDHTSTSGGPGCTNDGIWNSGPVAAGGTFTRIFSSAGTFPFHCNFHCSMGMVGSITVNNSTVQAVANAVNITTNFTSFPNPFTISSSVQFNLVESGNVKLELFDLFGIKVWETAEEPSSSGFKSFTIPGENLKDGIFICKIYYNGSPAASERIVKSSK